MDRRSCLYLGGTGQHSSLPRAIGPDSQYMTDFCGNYRFRRWAQVKKGWASSYSIPMSSLPPFCQHPGHTGWDRERETKFRARNMQNSMEGVSG